MGFFFLLAGYFTPRSLERKGYGHFLCDRFLRLGLPAAGVWPDPGTADRGDGSMSQRDTVSGERSSGSAA